MAEKMVLSVAEAAAALDVSRSHRHTLLQSGVSRGRRTAAGRRWQRRIGV